LDCYNNKTQARLVLEEFRLERIGKRL
jgi:hypothetical protein